MKPSTSDNFDPADVAASWVMRHDRGLSPAEQDEFLQWLAADPCHGEAMARHRRAWENFDRLAGLHASVPAVPDPDLLAPRARTAAANLAATGLVGRAPGCGRCNPARRRKPIRARGGHLRRRVAGGGTADAD